VNSAATKVVISQPMYFPWVGLLEQIRLADVFIHYSDVQYVRGFFNRVQIKTVRGSDWLTVPLRDQHRGQLISEVAIDERLDWRSKHREILRQSYRKTPYLSDLLSIFDDVVSAHVSNLADLSIASVMALAEYFDLTSNCRFHDSRDLGICGSSSQRLLDLTIKVGGATYITGHGARNYLNHEIFENAGITVQYINYQLSDYPQIHGAFTPYVSALDLVANCGSQGSEVIRSTTIPWREFIK
jgi:hypothetical protein